MTRKQNDYVNEILFPAVPAGIRTEEDKGIHPVIM